MKQITFDYEGKEYTLQYTRKSVETMERQGFIANDLRDKPMSMLPALFAGAFLAKHRYVKKALIDEIYDHMTNKSELIDKLSEMYNDALDTLISEPEESEGNVTWGASW